MCSLRVRNSLTESSPSPFLSAAASSSSTDSLSQSSGSKAFKTSAKPSEKIGVTAWEINYEFLSPCKVVLGCTPRSPLLSQLISGDGSRSVSIELLKCLEHLLIILPCDLPVVVVFEFQLLAGPFHHQCHSWRLWALGFSRCGRNVLGRGFRCGHGHVMSHQVITMETSSSPNVVLWRRIHKYPPSTTKQMYFNLPPHFSTFTRVDVVSRCWSKWPIESGLPAASTAKSALIAGAVVSRRQTNLGTKMKKEPGGWE